MQPNPSTTAKIHALLPILSEGDRVRLLHFAEAIIVQKQGKRRQRSTRFQSTVDESWRIGS